MAADGVPLDAEGVLGQSAEGVLGQSAEGVLGQSAGGVLELSAGGVLGHSEAVSALDPLFDGLGEGYGGATFVVGGAGLGKTTVLRQAEVRARSWSAPRLGRLLVGRADGVLFGSAQAFRFADQLFASLGADVLHDATGSNNDAPRSNRFLSALRALDDSSSRSPLLLLLDDLHWADFDSLAIVEFLCRQIATRPVAIVGTLRSWPAQAVEAVRRLELDGGVSAHELEPLSHDDSLALLTSRVWGDVAEDVLERAAASCGGNPLLIEEVARSLLGGSQVPAVEPFSTGRRAILLRRFAGVSDETFRYLRAASTLGDRFRPAIAARMVAFDAPTTDATLEEAVAAGVLEPSDTSVTFVHPMFRDALYEGIQGPLRMELHEAAFRAIRFVGGGVPQAARHAIAAGLCDDVAVSAMRLGGLEAMASGGWSDAKRLLGHAVQAAGQQASPDMICEFAEALVGAGSPNEAIDALEAIVDRPDVEGVTRGRVLVVLGQSRLASGNFDAPLECFDEAARVFEPLDPARSVDALLRAAFVARFFVGARETMSFAERARALSQSVGEATRLQIDAAWGSGAIVLGSKRGFEVLASVAETMEAKTELLDVFSESGWWPLVWCSAAAAVSEQFDAAQRAFELGFAAAERRGWPAEMGAHLVNQVDLLVRLGHLQQAELELGRLESLVELAPVLGPMTMMMRTGFDLERGNLVEAEIGCAGLDSILEVFKGPPPSFLLWSLLLRGKLEFALGRMSTACAAFERAEKAARTLGVEEPCIVPWWAPAVDCYSQEGRFSDLERIVEWLEDVTGNLPCRWPRAGSMAGRAMLAEQAGECDSARKCFENALSEMEGVPMPLERALLLTWQGTFLRRRGDLRQARRSLSTAFQLADSRGSELVANRARSELRRAGGRLRRAARASGGLTPRESQVAFIASAGRTTAEIAEELGIAPKTVEHHLEAVYRKFEIRSRRELMRKIFEGELELDPGVAVTTRAPNAPDAEARP
jgi:DNA-binding CsgD family transcriptional regulator